MQALRKRLLSYRLENTQARVKLLQDSNSADIDDLQLTRLQEVWHRAVNEVPYYREIVRKGIAPEVFASIKEYSERVPVLTKQIIKSQPDMFRRQSDPDYWSMTAGSTGEPMRFGVWKSEAEVNAANALAMRCFRGMDPLEDGLFLIWGHSHLLGTGMRGWSNNKFRRLKDRLLGYSRVNAYHMDRETSRHYFGIMLGASPKVLVGYSNAVDLLVRHNIDREIQAQDLNLKYVICTAENLPKSGSADLIENFFGSSLMMEYGGVDFGNVAHKWRCDPYLVNWWDCLCETDLNCEASTNTSLLVTALYPRYLPLFRFDTGDEVSLPSRGNNGQVLKFGYLEGRYHDAIVLEDGTAIHSVGLFHCIHQESNIANIQLILEPVGLRILLVGQPNENATNRIRRRLSDLAPSLSNCSIEYVEDLRTNRAGKRRWIVDHR